MGSETYPKSFRLRRRAEFLAVQRRGRKVHGDYFLLLFVRGDVPRIGITVSSKVGKSVVRNRIKRWVREYVRRHKGELPPGDSVIVAKASAAEAEHRDIDADLARIMRRAREESR